jgi:hypothetical protein
MIKKKNLESLMITKGLRSLMIIKSAVSIKVWQELQKSLVFLLLLFGVLNILVLLLSGLICP